MATDTVGKANDGNGGDHSEPITDQLKHAAQGDDEPLEEKKPAATFALVTLAYPMVLILAILALLFVLSVYW